MKKILFIINSLGGGGAEKALIEFLRHIDYTRYEVSLCLVFHELSERRPARGAGLLAL